MPTRTARTGWTGTLEQGVGKVSALRARLPVGRRNGRRRTGSAGIPQRPPDTAAVPKQTASERNVDKGSGTIFQALTWGPLPTAYSLLFRLLLSLPPDQSLTADEIATRLKIPVGSVQAQLSKLSGRVKRVAPPADLPVPPKSPLTLMLSMLHTPHGTKYAPASGTAGPRDLAEHKKRNRRDISPVPPDYDLASGNQPSVRSC